MAKTRTYKGYKIRPKTHYHVQRGGYTLTTGSTLAQAKSMAARHIRKSDVNGLTILKEPYYSIEQNGFSVSTARTIAAAKQQINKW